MSYRQSGLLESLDSLVSLRAGCDGERATYNMGVMES